MQKSSCIHTLSTSRTALTLLLTATAAQAAWADSAFSGGTEAAPYKIATTADLNQLATDVNGVQRLQRQVLRADYRHQVRPHHCVGLCLVGEGHSTDAAIAVADII